jgi:hypothetical protein
MTPLSFCVCISMCVKMRQRPRRCYICELVLFVTLCASPMSHYRVVICTAKTTKIEFEKVLRINERILVASSVKWQQKKKMKHRSVSSMAIAKGSA